MNRIRTSAILMFGCIMLSALLFMFSWPPAPPKPLPKRPAGIYYYENACWTKQGISEEFLCC